MITRDKAAHEDVAKLEPLKVNAAGSNTPLVHANRPTPIVQSVLLFLTPSTPSDRKLSKLEEENVLSPSLCPPTPPLITSDPATVGVISGGLQSTEFPPFAVVKDGAAADAPAWTWIVTARELFTLGIPPTISNPVSGVALIVL